LVKPLTARDGSCVKLAQRKNLPYGKKKAAGAKTCLHIDTSEASVVTQSEARAKVLLVA
jgi:hypothetical protein